ncbi:MAG: hypothetical protein OWP43_00470 [Sphaerochaetaceae bacterium]|nr:hypothetical protein [Sphaerochaetaceae bacterium]
MNNRIIQYNIEGGVALIEIGIFTIEFKNGDTGETFQINLYLIFICLNFDVFTKV